MDAGSLSIGVTVDGGAGPMTTNQPDPQLHPINDASPSPDASNPPKDVTRLAEDALDQTTLAMEALTKDVSEPAPLVMEDFGAAHDTEESSEIGLLGDVDLDVRIELGRTRMLVADVLKLTPDSVVELDKAAGDPVDIYVNGRHVARGEVLVLNENFCVRISEIIGKGTAPATPV